MFWASLVIVMAAVGLMKLGALTVWVNVLSSALIAAGLVAGALLLFILWRLVAR